MARDTQVTLLGTTLPVPRWTVQAFGVVAILFCVALAYRQFWPAAPELVTLKAANERLQAEISEYNMHIGEEPERRATLVDDARGTLSVNAYTDGCLLVRKTLPGGVASAHLVTSFAASQRSLDFLPVVHAAEREACAGYHPGRFSTGYGRRLDQCWVEVVRTFEDGCQHVQLYNACNGSWDANRDGSPKVRWTQCRH